MMTELSEPSADLVSRVTAQLEFKHRFVGYRVRKRAGPMAIAAYNLEEVVGLLNDEFPQLNLERLEEWVRTVIGDEELADRISEAIATEKRDHDRILRVRRLMSQRLCQCNRTLGA